MARKLSRRSLATYAADQLLAGTSQQDVALHLAAYLIDHRRTKELEVIIRDIEYFLAEKGVTAAIVTSAFDLSEETKRSIESFVTQKTGAKRIALDAAVDPSVLGGVKISLPGRELDRTVAHQLTVLKTRFKEA